MQVENSNLRIISYKHFFQVVFITFELFVSIMQFNMLIAMMTRTYETIFQTQLEYKRQVFLLWKYLLKLHFVFQRAQVILMLELSLSPKERHQYLLKYSRPTGTNKKTRSLVVSKKSSVSSPSLTSISISLIFSSTEKQNKGKEYWKRK